jgi:UDP:flavonoid glycosyltransferase YjiC (YdhE family)
MEEVLGKVGCEVRLYGKGALPRKGNIMYRKTGPDSFTDDLVTCRAVISSAGNQLVGETMWLGKPILVIPEHSMDQRLNARSVVDYRVGMQTTYDLFTTGLIENFLRNEHRFRKNCEKYARDATTEVIRIVQQRALAGHAAKQPHPALQIIPPESFSRTARPAPLRAPDLHASGRP